MRTFTLDDILSFESRYRGHFVNCLSGYKAANVIGSKDANGHENLAIISSAVHIGATPPTMGFIFRPHTVPRHTLENIMDTGFFTVNHVDEKIYESAHQSSARYSKDESEFDATGLTPLYRDDFFAPFVQESPLQMGFRFVERVDIQHNPTHFIIGELVNVSFNDAALAGDGFIDLDKIGSLAISGLDSYHRVSTIERCSYAKAH